MGGPGSGQWIRPYGKETIEGVLTLSIHSLIRDGQLRPQSHTSGTLTWRRVSTGEQTASCGYEVNTLDMADAWLRLHYTITRRYDAQDALDYRIPLTTIRPHFGGVLWFFRCPVNDRRCAKLYLPPGARYFASRQAYDLVYESQREDRTNCALRRAQDIRMRLGGSGNMSLPFPPKPKGMHWNTYARLQDRAQKAEWEMYEGLAAWLNRLK